MMKAPKIRVSMFYAGFRSDGTRHILPRIRIEDAGGEKVLVEVMQDKSGKISLRLPADGTFRLIISDADGQAGDYELHVDIIKRKLPPWLLF